MHTLLIRLSGPLQSWGSESLYDNRETDYFPTKSAVIGMIAAALGRGREESCEDLNAVRFGVRIDHQGTRVRDFQITDMGERLSKNLSTRFYLSDATFLVGLSSEQSALLEEIQKALHHPKFALFLGRKACPPTLPLELGIQEKDLYTALYEQDWLVSEFQEKRIRKKRKQVVLRIVVEEEGGSLKKDAPISFQSTYRQYGYRYCKDMPGKVIMEDVRGETEHDPMKELEE